MRLVRIYNHGTIKSTCTCINIVITYHGNTLHLMVRASKRTHNCQSNSKGAHVALFRRAWNAFIRLLDIDLLSSFQCPICGPCPDTVVCDGMMLGFRKDLLPSCIPTQHHKTMRHILSQGQNSVSSLGHPSAESFS